MDKTSSIRTTARSTVVLLTLVVGIIAFLSTHWVNSPGAGNSTLFGLAWGCGALGVALAGFIICACLAAEFGNPSSVGFMLGWFATLFIMAGGFMAVIGDMSTTSYVTDKFGNSAIYSDDMAHASITASFVAGYVFGFFILLGIHLNNSWTGEGIETSTDATQMTDSGETSKPSSNSDVAVANRPVSNS